MSTPLRVAAAAIAAVILMKVLFSCVPPVRAAGDYSGTNVIACQDMAAVVTRSRPLGDTCAIDGAHAQEIVNALYLATGGDPPRADSAVVVVMPNKLVVIAYGDRGQICFNTLVSLRIWERIVVTVAGQDA